MIIVNWNSKEYLKKCIASILRNTRGLTFEIVVIDSGSFDGTDQMLREHYPSVRFLQSQKNIGFARANNRAFAESTGRCILFLNPDTELIGPAISVLHSAMNSLTDAGVVGPKLLNSDSSLQSSCIQSLPTLLNQLLDSDFLRRKWPRSALWGMAPLYEAAQNPRRVEATSGACLMIRRNAFLRVGLFSEEYFMYAEDLDLAYKLRRAGYQNYYVPEATVVHHGGNSSQHAASTFAAVMMPEAIWRFLRKTRGKTYGLGYRAIMCVSSIGRIMMLATLSRLWTSTQRKASFQGSFHKWLAVLRWSLNRDHLVKQHYPARGVTRDDTADGNETMRPSRHA